MKPYFIYFVSLLFIPMLVSQTGCSKEVVEEIETPASNLDSDDITISLEGELQI